MTSLLRMGFLSTALVLAPGVGTQALAQATASARKATPTMKDSVRGKPVIGHEERGGKQAPQGPAKLPARTFKLEDAEKLRLADRKRDESIEGLKKIIPSIEDGTPQKAELLYRLSELYWDKSKYLYFTEMTAFEAEQLKWDEALQRGEKIPEPKVDHRQSELMRSETMRLYELILKEYPDYARKDEVLFNLAYNQYELDRKDEAVKRYTELIKNYPDSQFAGDVYVQLGNHHFEVTKDVSKARENYQAASQSKDPRIFSYAIYRLAWCDYNVGEYQGGLERLQKVVAMADGKSAAKNRDLVDLKTEALNDSVRFFVALNLPDDALAYYKQKASKKRAPVLSRRLADGMAEAGHSESAIKVYRTMINEAPMGPLAPEFQQGIVRAFEKLRQRDQVREEIRRLASLYSPGSSWWTANKSDAGVLRNAFNVTEEAMRTTVTEYHQEAQKTKQVETYRLARDIYKQYVEKFASSEDPAFVSDNAFGIRFFYAEILWALEEWQAAAEQYQAVVAFKVPDRDVAKQLADEKYRKSAAYSAVLAYEKVVRIDRGLAAVSKLKDSDKVDENKKKGEVEKGKRLEKSRNFAELKARELTANEGKLVAACDAYNTLYPGNSDEIDVRYQAAVLFYDANQFVEATRRFGDIIARFPTEKRSQDAADLSMDVLNVKEEWLALNQLSREFLANKKLWKPGTEFGKRLTEVVEGSQYKYVDEVIYKQEKNPARAAELFVAFADEFPKSDNADRALTYVMFIAQEANEIDRATQAGERVLKDYPGSAFELKVRYTLAGLYEKLADFKRSAEAYEAFIAAHDAFAGIGADGKPAKPARGAKSAALRADKTVSPEEKAALIKEAAAWLPDAQYNAGVWWEGLGQNDKAIAAFNRYIERFKSKDDVPQIAFRVARILERQKKWPEAIKAFESFGTTYAKDKRAKASEHYRALYRRYLAHVAMGATKDAERLQGELVKEYAKLPKDQQDDGNVKYAYAHARFQALEPMWKSYTDVKLNQVSSLVKNMKTKQAALPGLKKAYEDVLAIGVGDWGIAALTRIGLAYGDLAENIVKSPDPKGLDMDQLDMYRAELESLALPLEDNCIEALELALSKAFELSVYNDWAIQAQDKVNQYRRGTYAERREVPFRGSDFFRTSPVLKEVGVAKAAPVKEQPKTEPAGGTQSPKAPEQPKGASTKGAAGAGGR